ncbi:MAG: PAS domain S-box protein [Desulfobacterales bacterium]|nr:PAS domain S-box protein [Desulfobacterales bacterium]
MNKKTNHKKNGPTARNGARANTDAPIDEQFREIEEYLDTLIYQSPAVICAHRIGDDQWEITYVSDNIEGVLGFDPAELAGAFKQWQSCVHPDDIDDLIERMRRAKPRDDRREYEYRFRDKNGKYHWLYDQQKVVSDADQPIEILSAFWDITERKELELALRESRARFAQMAEQNRTVIWEVDSNGLFTYVSHVAETLYGYPPEEIMGQRHFYDLHPETGREAFKTSVFKIFEEKRSFKDLEHKFLSKTGELIWISTTGLPVLNDDGTLAGYRGSDTDITSRKRAEIELRESEKKFRVLSNDLPALICEFLPDGTLTFVNKAYCEYFGMSARKLIGRQFLDFLPPEKRKSAKEKYMALTPRQPVAVSEFKTTRHDMPRWLEWRNRAIFDESGQAVKFQGIGLDISERKEREKQLRETSRFHEAAAELATAIANMRIDSMDEGIQQCLAILGNYLSAQQGYIFSSDFENSMWTKTHEWCDKGDPSQTIPFRHLAFDTFPGLVERFARGERIALASRAELPETMNSAWERLLKKQVKALIMQPMLVDGQLIGFLAFFDTAEERVFTDTDHGLLSLAADNFAATFARQKLFLREEKANQELKRAVERANKLATTDDLTGLWNRRYFMDALAREIERARRYGHVFSLLTLDIDYFKHINDTFGHAAGDMVLQHMAEILRNSLRHPDVAARIGGEEFSLILPNTGLDDALTLAERLRWSIEKTPAAYQDREIFYTVSIGAAAYHPNIRDKDELLRLADKALYRAKDEGRNRVETEKS